jgi:tetratricopeptide (TPR) repeat protein
MDIDSFWEYADPASSEGRFRSALSSAQRDERLELLTQIARSYGLRQRFAEAHELLNEVEKELADAGPRPRIRYLLERGRTHNSGGEAEKARVFFVEAWDLHDMGRFAEALPVFEEALAVWLARGKPKQILVAKWSVARCLRSLGRNEDALAILHELEAEHGAADSIDGTVFEEIAENLAALGEVN